MTAPGPSTVEGTTWMRVGRRYRAPLLVRAFPPEVPFGFLGRVLPTTDELELLVEAHRLPDERALEILRNARSVAEAELQSGSNGGATTELELERDSAEELARSVARRAQELWKVGVRFTAFGSSRPRAEAGRARLAERLATFGFRSRTPRYEVREAVAAPNLDPGTPRPSGYWQTLPTDGVAALFPFADETLLEPRGTLVGLALSDASPVFLDRFAHASHSWAVFGATGSGKTFAAALLALRGRWVRPDMDLIVLDPLGEYGEFVRALGGSVVRLADPAQGRLNPLDPVTTAGDRREKASRVGTMLRALYPSLKDEEAATLDAVVHGLYDSGPEVPTFEDLVREVAARRRPGDERLSALLDVFRTGSLRSLSGPTSLRLDASPISVDFRGVAEDQLPFHLTYILDWAYGRLRSARGPKLLLLDEAHLLARHGATAEFLDRVVRHVRHFAGGLLLVSQNPDDFLGTASGRSLLRNLYATAFLRLGEVSPATREFFGLTPAESEWLPKARLPREAGYSESLWRVGALHLPLAIVASTPEFEFLTETLSRPPSTE